MMRGSDNCPARDRSKIRRCKAAGDEESRVGTRAPGSFNRAEHDRQAFRFALMSEDAGEQGARTKSQFVAKPQCVGFLKELPAP